MEFAQRLYDMIAEEDREKIIYKPSAGLPAKVQRRIEAAGANDGRDKQTFSDIEFIVGAERTSFYGIRFVFGVFSPYFEQRLYGENACGPTLELPELNVEGFRCVFAMVYGLPPPLTIQNVMAVMETAQSMGVDFLVGECLGFLGQNINGKNVLNIFDAALRQNILTPPFERQCCKVILNKSKQVLESEAFLSTGAELMTKIVECDFFFVNETRLWQRLVLWAKTRIAIDLEQQFDEEKGDMSMPDEDQYDVGDEVVLVSGRVGKVLYKGEVGFAAGTMFGIDLSKGKGDTSGTVEDAQYFEATNEMGGTFVRASRIGGKMPDVDWGEEWKPPCDCGNELIKMKAVEVYPGDINARCNLCRVEYSGEDDQIFHCPKNKMTAHPRGYDICQICVNGKKVKAKKRAEILLPNKRDVKYLRQVIPFVRFPIMPKDYFIDQISPLLPRPLAESVLVSEVVPATTCIFPTLKRMSWSTSVGAQFEYTVVAASHEKEKALKLPDENTQAEWSRLAMNSAGGRQWFIIDVARAGQLTSVSIKNYYGDGDTVKDVSVYSMAAGTEWNEEENEGGNWLKEADFASGKTSAWQNNLPVGASGVSRWWKFVVTSAHGGEGNYICLDHLKVFGERDEDEEVEEDDDDDEDENAVRMMEQPYSVMYASHEQEKAVNIVRRGAEAGWSGKTMSAAGGAQWFIADLGAANSIKKVEIKHQYADADTIRNMEVYYLPEGVDMDASQRVDEGGAWVKGCDLLSAQTTDVQILDLDVPETVRARFWKFRVISVYGGGLDATNYPALHYMVISIAQPMWTTGLATVV